jgi:hypothetical protein
MNEGIAIAASRPMIATTIMISTNVNPDLPRFIVFLLLSSATGRESELW